MRSIKRGTEAMKISALETWPANMTLSEPYNIAYEHVDSSTNIFLKIATDRHIIGYGCAAPDLQITGETPESVTNVLKDLVEPSIKGSDPLRTTMILEKLKPLMKGQPSALAAVDMALYDILGKACNQPLWRLLGGFRDRVKTSITIGIMSELETVVHAWDMVKRGFKCLKLKGGIDVNSDIDRVMKVREAVGKDIEIRFDANQGFSVDETIRFVKETGKANLELIEQPTAKNQPNLLEKVTNRVQIPVMADESLMTLRDAFRIARGGLADMVNVKLMKVGGISEALQINAVARSARMEVMVGCMDESALAIAAGLHFALARPNVRYADLDGHLGLKGDPFQDTVILRNGTLFPSHRPGLGLAPSHRWVSPGHVLNS